MNKNYNFPFGWIEKYSTVSFIDIIFIAELIQLLVWISKCVDYRLGVKVTLGVIVIA